MEDHYFEEIEKYINSFKLHVEDEKKEIAECQKKFSTLLNAFSEKAPSNSVLNSLFKDDEPEGFVFSKYEDKRKQLAEQRRAEYNAYLEKKEAERRAKQRTSQEKIDVRPKSILDSVDYESILAKRREEEAKFRNNSMSTPAIELPGAVMSAQQDTRLLEERRRLEALEKENARLLEERLAKQLEEQRNQILLQYEKELRKNNQIKEELESLKSSNSVKSMPQRIEPKVEELPKLRNTGGGGEPVRDSYGNLLAMRGLRKENTSDYGIMSFPSMQQESSKDRITLYREELQKQIEEKRRLEALEKEKHRQEEERIAQRMEEQRLKLLAEYENELKKPDKVKEEFLRQQERLRQLEEFQRKDAEARRKRLAVVKTPDPPKAPPPVIERSTSPPIPAVRTKVLLEKVVPPRSVTPELKQENPMSSLAEIRRRIMEEQKKTNKDSTNSYKVMNRRTVQEVSDDEDDDIFRSSTNSYNLYSS